MKQSFYAFILSGVLLPDAGAATVEFSCLVSVPSPEAAAAVAVPIPRIYDFFVTTDADILSIGNVLIDSTNPPFSVDPPFGSNTRPPDPIFIDLNRALELDSWITTPGDTSRLGPDLNETDGTTTFGDLSNDGPQDMFHFARLTFPENTTATINLRVTVAGASGPESFGFFGCIPEPSSLVLVQLFAVCVVLSRRQAS